MVNYHQIGLKLNDYEIEVVDKAYNLLTDMQKARTTRTDFAREMLLKVCQEELDLAEQINKMAEAETPRRGLNTNRKQVIT